jgi:MYXO-CTERM domain-containing protein
MSFKPILSLGALAAAFAVASSAQAQTCTTNAQCHKGFICVTAPTNIGTPTPAPAPADPTAPAKISALVAPQTGYCQQAPCTADSDCGTGMVCHTETIKACSGSTAPACPANTDCGAKVAPPPPETCTETKVSICAFTWQLPCNTDTDCGAGFVCNPTVSGTCSGGTGVATPGSTGTASGGGSAPSTGATAPADPGFAAPVIPPPDTCTTTTSFPGYCSVKATTCASNTDCPTDWTCTEVPTRGGGVATSSSGAAGTSGSTNVGGVPADLVPPAPGPTTPPVMMCTSPYSGGYAVAKDATSNTGGGGSTQGPSGAGAAGTGGGTVPPTAMTPTPTHESAGPNGTSPSAGCAVAGGSSSAAFAALALLGIVLARRRR